MQLLKPVCFLFLLLTLLESRAERADSFAVKHTDIHLTVRNFNAKTIYGSVTHFIRLKVATNGLSLDLAGMTVDSVKNGNTAALMFTRVKDRLKIQLEKVYNANDSFELEVFYHGTPAADPTGWGGFYFTPDFAYNLGVGFGVDPHSYGRAWFPCVDEFRMKSSYDFYITTDTGYSAACNGVEQSIQQFPNGTVTWHYAENKPLSAYLASVTVSKFALLHEEYKGVESDFPIWLFCLPSDTTKVKNSFINLPKAIGTFEKAFGPQVYSKVGYNFVPFKNGAMEHAGNITFPSIYADGTLNYEHLMAHELSHHWWGDNVTCVSEGDMWLNEGWASYCEHFFQEQVYGKAAYRRSILNNHLYVLRFAHINDGTAFPMVDIPHANTYGDHVYKKGADMVHSLRGVMGDSIFFKACKAYQKAYRFGNAATIDLQHVFEQNGGGTRATDFFNNWIYEKGFPHVIISKQVHSGNGPYQLKFYTLQRPRFTNKLYTNMPVEVFFFKDRNTYEKREVLINSQTDSFVFTFNFRPVYVCLDYDEKLSDAITDRTVITNKTDTVDLPETFSRLLIRNNTDSSLIRVEHHWIGPELFRIDPPYMSNYRYYTVDGIWNDAFNMDMELTYDGRASTLGYLDHTLIYKTEDSLVLLYRLAPGDHWRICPDVQFMYGNSKNDKSGKVLVKNAKKGDYVLAMYDKNLGLGTGLDNNGFFWTVSPNPASGSVLVTFSGSVQSLQGNGHLIVYDQDGREVGKSHRESGQCYLTIDTRLWHTGVYTLVYQEGTSSYSKKLVFSR
jgi:hypothetical protein